MRWKTTIFWLVFLLLDFVFLPKNGWLSYNWFTDYTSCLSRFMVVVRRLVQFCFASVKGYFPANSSVSVHLRPCLFHLETQHYWMVLCGFHHQHLQSDFNLAMSSSLERQELRFHAMSPKPGKLFRCPKQHFVRRPPYASTSLAGLQDCGDIVGTSVSHLHSGRLPTPTSNYRGLSLYSIAKQPACARSDISSSASAFELSAIQARGQPSHHQKELKPFYSHV